MTSQELIIENLELKSRIVELENLLKYDALTKTKSKAELLKLQNNRSEITKKLVIVLDIRNFGEFNKIYGHLEGDKFLVSFAEKLKRIFRKNDCVYRFGGDEFVIVLEISENYKEDVIRKRLQKLWDISYVGIAIGLDSVENLLRIAFDLVEKEKLRGVK